MGEFDKCEYCKYAMKHTVYWSCHRHPPVLQRDGQSRFPSIFTQEWCGEWSANDEVLAKRRANFVKGIL